MKDIYQESLEAHAKIKGKLEIKTKMPLKTTHDLSIAYTPGVAEPCRAIHKNKEEVYTYTWKSNTIAIVSDGSAVLGLGNIGPEASLPVLEGKSLLFKDLGNINCIPIALQTQKTDEIIETIKNIAPSFGAICLEDISAPHCFLIEESLQDLGIPVVHDDQHGTAIVLLAALINACKVTGKKLSDLRIVISGAGAAGIAITKLLLCVGLNKNICEPVKEIIICDRKGPIYKGRKNDMNEFKEWIANHTNQNQIKGTLADAMKNADVFIGVSAPNLVSIDMVKSMAEQAIVFAMANPQPEIMPEDALKGGAAIVGTGRSDYPNQINNVLGFPGLFRGALDAKAKVVNGQMKVAAAHALAKCIKPTKKNIIASPLDRSVVKKVAAAVVKAAKESGVCR